MSGLKEAASEKIEERGEIMVVCPKCQSSIPSKKLIFLTNFNTIKCDSCSSILKANKKIMSMIGAIGSGIGGGLGAFFLINWSNTGELIYLLLIVPLFLLLFFGVWAGYIKLMKFETLESKPEIHSTTPPISKS